MILIAGVHCFSSAAYRVVVRRICKTLEPTGRIAASKTPHAAQRRRLRVSTEEPQLNSGPGNATHADVPGQTHERNNLIKKHLNRRAATRSSRSARARRAIRRAGSRGLDQLVSLDEDQFVVEPADGARRVVKRQVPPLQTPLAASLKRGPRRTRRHPGP
jgi:hypothetical protein